jgi:hypothetical protein
MRKRRKRSIFTLSVLVANTSVTALIIVSVLWILLVLLIVLLRVLLIVVLARVNLLGRFYRSLYIEATPPSLRVV